MGQMDRKSKVEVKIEIFSHGQLDVRIIRLESPSRKRIFFLMFMQVDGFLVYVSSMAHLILYKSLSHFV